jgi:hypothetical protein
LAAPAYFSCKKDAKAAWLFRQTTCVFQPFLVLPAPAFFSTAHIFFTRRIYFPDPRSFLLGRAFLRNLSLSKR